MPNFIHLHLHSEFSLLDGACRVSELPAAAASLGQSAAAITDHGNMFGAVDFFKACAAGGVRPVIGCEVYAAKNSRFDRIHGEDPGHLILLATGEVGYKNLIYLVSAAWTEGFYGKPRVDLELLRGRGEGIIALSACLAGFIPRYLLDGDYAGARDYALELDGIFGHGNFYLELQNHSIPEQITVNKRIIQLAKDTGLPLVATNDVHYIKKEDAQAQAIMMCIQTNNVITEGRPIGFSTDEFYMKSAEEMAVLFGDVPEALENTVRIAERCNFGYKFDKIYLPSYAVPDKREASEYLRSLCREGLEVITAGMEAGKASQYRERLEYELGVIISMGYADYYLIVWDFIRYAKENGVPVGPGRGSGAGSLCAYALGITEVDPIRYNLLFERFLNPERVSMPDFDIDLCQEKRGKVVDYVIEKYGADKCAHIITFGTMAARLAVRDVGRALGMSYASVDVIAKLIPRELGITLKNALERPGELKRQYESSEEVRNLLDMAMKLEGMPRNASTHAAGIVITEDRVNEYVPVAVNSEMVVTQFDMNTVAELGLLKMDLLGLRFLTIIDKAVEEVRKGSPDFDIRAIPEDDKEVFGMLGAGSTAGIFQFESGGMTNLLINLKPESLEDIIAAISLYRPGPMDSIPRYIEYRHKKGNIKYKHPLLEDILDVTYGCIVYQEQVMQICRKLAGYSYAMADIVRRAMSKKKADVMEKERKYFIYGKKSPNGEVECAGCVANGVDERTASEIFDEMTDFARYAFNKSHAAAYAVISYRTAYLKYHHTREYLAAILSSVLNDTDKIYEYTKECGQLGISILPPDINASGAGFAVSEGGIRYGLLAIKNVGEGYINNIAAERGERGPFKSFADFLYRMNKYDFNKRQVEALIKCGVFDSLGEYRSRLLKVYEGCIDELGSFKRKNSAEQLNMFEDEALEIEYRVEYPQIPELPLSERLRYEKEAAGRYFSGHPLEEYGEHIKALGGVDISGILASFGEEGDEDFRDGENAVTAGIVVSVKQKATKKGETMAFAELEDEYGSMEALVFPRVYEQYSQLLRPGAAVAAAGTISVREDEPPKLLLNALIPLIKNGDFDGRAEGFPQTEVRPSKRPRYNGEVSHAGAQGSPPAQKRPPVSPAAGAEESRTLFVRIEGLETDKAKKALNLLEYFEGSHPVAVYDTTTRTINKRGWRSDMSESLLGALAELLGAENVAAR